MTTIFPFDMLKDIKREFKKLLSRLGAYFESEEDYENAFELYMQGQHSGIRYDRTSDRNKPFTDKEELLLAEAIKAIADDDDEEIIH